MNNAISVGVDDMYENYFLDYASYVILERAVPAGNDGLKPVQRRLLHSLRRMHDGRYHKVANVIGHTMQFHPHGDAAIGAALVNMGQKDLLIDCQGNWGDIRTGDSAAAPRYIEARLTPFAVDVLFNPQTTQWQLSYDGRNKEPIHLPAKFPLVLATGVEGIAVGLSTKIMPHNFNEIIDAAIQYLKGRRVKLYPDFQTGGMVDVTDYQQGKRGGKIKVRARIEAVDKKTLSVTELPYGVTTNQMIDSILKANDKGKIKIKKVQDNTAKEVDIRIEIATGMSPDVIIDALYAFTNCEVSISPNACVIIDNKPHFLSIQDILAHTTDRTRDLLGQELEIKLEELRAAWHFASLEKIFIQQRIYRRIEECESWEQVLEEVATGLAEYVRTPLLKATKEELLVLDREITEEDITKLTEIKIKRISKYNVFKAEEALQKLLDEIAEVEHHLAHLTDYAIEFYQGIKDKYGKDHTRRTEIREFYEVSARDVVMNNATLYVNRKEGFFGHGLKKEEEVGPCADIDDIIVIRRDGTMMVSRIADKTFFGKDIIHIAVWKAKDDRTTYNLIYRDGIDGKTMAKRFHVSAITRDKPYDLTAGTAKSKILYLTVNPNGEAEIVEVKLSPSARARQKTFEYDFSTLSVKGRGSKGNTLTKYPVRNIKMISTGQSTLAAMQFYYEDQAGRITTDKTDELIGDFQPDDLCLWIDQLGRYQLFTPTQHHRIPSDEMIDLAKWIPDETVITAVYYDGEKKWTVVKRFKIETTKTEEWYGFLTEHPDTTLLFATTRSGAKVSYSYRKNNDRISDVCELDDFIDVKGWKARGNRLQDRKIKVEEVIFDEPDTLRPGDTIDFDIEPGKQQSLFD